MNSWIKDFSFLKDNSPVTMYHKASVSRLWSTGLIWPAASFIWPTE